MTERSLAETLKSLLKETNLADLKKELQQLQGHIYDVVAEESGVLPFALDLNAVKKDFKYILNEIEQILDTRTIERAAYYLKRLIKSLTEVKTGKINSLNLNRWKEYEDIITDSLWILHKRDRSGVHTAGYWGNFIPQIPNQLIRRYTKENEWVLDPFAGSGTTLIECKRLGRNCIGVELSPDIAALASKNVENEKPVNKSECKIITSDSTKLDFKEELYRQGIKSVQLIILHPPYWDIIKFTGETEDLSNSATVEEYIERLGQAVESTYHVLDKGRYLALVIGDKYSKGELIPLGFYAMQEVLKHNYKLKSIVVKNFDETRGKMNSTELWRYRALIGGFYIFKHEYLFLFRK